MRTFLPYRKGELGRACDELDRWRDRLDAKGPLPRTWHGRLRRDLEAEAVTASTAMEGVAVTVAEVHRILAGDRPKAVSEHDARLVAGYRDAMNFVLRRADDPACRWDREMIVAIHDRVLAGDDAAGAGRFREGPRYLVDGTTSARIFNPAEASACPALVDAACDQMNAFAAHPALAAAWIHVAVAAIHPFGDGNGRVARILSSLTLCRAGYKRPQFTSLEEWWGNHRQDYYAAFRCLGDSFRSRADVTPFVRAHLGAQLSQVRALDLRERTERQIWIALENMLQDRSLAPRLSNALWDALFERDVTAGYYRQVADISAATATSDLAAATAARLLCAEGQRRGRRYRQGDQLLPTLASALEIDLATAQNGLKAIVVHLTKRLLAGDAR